MAAFCVQNSPTFLWTQGFTLAIACIITSLSTAIFVLLLRRGAITTSDAAPLGTLDRCRVIRLDKPGGLTSEDAKLLAPSDDGEEVACPICMEVRFNQASQHRRLKMKALGS